jgi:hypothetical protein
MLAGVAGFARIIKIVKVPFGKVRYSWPKPLSSVISIRLFLAAYCAMVKSLLPLRLVLETFTLPNPFF